jgi:hypothetical protein
MIAAAGNEVIHAQLDNFKIKDGKVTLTAAGIADDGSVLALNHVGKKLLKIVVADPEKHDMQREGLEPDPDQPEMELDDDDTGTTQDAADEADLENDPDFDKGEPEAVNLGDTDPEKMGAAARAAGAKMKENPFEKDTEDFNAWKAGWKSGAEDQTEAADENPDDDGTEENVGDNPGVMGRLARMQGAGPDDNPFDGGTDDYLEWSNAWIATDKDVQGVVQAGRDEFVNGGDRDSRGGWKEGSDAHKFWLEGFDAAAAEAAEVLPEEPKTEAQPEESENPEPPEVEDAPKPNATDSHGAGRDAFADGQPIEANPFDAEGDKVKHRIWNRGWQEAHDEGVTED